MFFIFSSVLMTLAAIFCANALSTASSYVQSASQYNKYPIKIKNQERITTDFDKFLFNKMIQDNGMVMVPGSVGTGKT